MTPGFWLVVAMAAIILAAAAVWLWDRCADAYDWYTARRREGCDCTELCPMGPTCPGGMLAQLPGAGCWRTDPPNEQDPR